jgi:nitrate/nitrite-specific signal transduction histidine kinase
MVGNAVSDQSRACPTGLAGRLEPEVVAGLATLTRVGRALTATGSLDDIARHALGEMRTSLDLEAVVLYVPAARGRPVLHRYLELWGAGNELCAAEQLDFDEDAWHLAFDGGNPIVFREPGGWFVENPFSPPADFWLVLPLKTAGHLLGAVIASRAEPVTLDPLTATLLALLGEQLGAGLATARLREEQQRAELEHERMRLAAEVHDGLAQDLALAVRELAYLDSVPPPGDAEASRGRLSAAVTAAHRLVRARLIELSAAVPAGSLSAAVEETCERFVTRGLAVDVVVPGESPEVSATAMAAIVRVLTEALNNIDKHAGVRSADVEIAAAEEIVMTIRDHGSGFDPAGALGHQDGHLGLWVMSERARDAGGVLEVTTAPRAGTTVTLRLPL